MLWFILALLGAFFDATHYALIKRYLTHIDQYTLSAGVFISTSLFLFLVTLWRGIPALGSSFITAVLATSIINVAAAILFYKALKITDLSLAVPMISFTPLFLILTSLLQLGELPSFFGIIGIVLIVLGSYVLYTGNHHRSLRDPFISLVKNKGTIYMLMVAFLFSISSNFDKLAVLNSDAYFSSAVVMGIIGISFLALARAPVKIYAIHSPKMAVAGLALALVAVAINLAFTMQIVPYVISLKRVSVLFSVAYGGLMFRETQIVRRSIGSFIMVAGMIAIVLLG